MKIFCYCLPIGDTGDVKAIAVSETGDGLVTHISSNPDWAKTDLGIHGAGHYTLSYDKQYGAGNWELEWSDTPAVHPGILEAIRLNRERAAQEQ